MLKVVRKIEKHIAAFLIASVSTLLVCNWGPLENVTKNVIRGVYSKFKGRTQTILDDAGIPIVDYGYIDGIYIGKQRNPVTVCQKALEYYENYEKGDKIQRQLFLNCANWLVDNSTPYGNYSILEYKFVWPIYDMTPPWRSGMAQAQALQVLIKAHNLTKDEKYLNTAKKLLNSFFYEVIEGGVTYKTSTDGWWYEEYADDNGKVSMVLNGMMSALLGIYDYYEYTKDTAAKYLFDQGVLGLKKNLPRYDKNGYSYYDILGHLAGEKYHDIHIWQLQRLYEITHEEIFKKYHDRWASYRELPFVIRLFKNPLTKMEAAIFVSNFIVLFVSIEIVIFISEKGKRFMLKRRQQCNTV